jgi:UDP-N-acetylmuramate dehydrogenase
VLSVFPDLKENVEKKWYGKVAVASLIERLGLKGYRVGNAQISEKHALFIVNLGDAIPEDVLAIIKKVQETFMEKFGFTLETEVEIVS